MSFTQIALRLAIALGIGLLIGAERERRKGSGPSRAAAGIRTFALVSLSGAISLIVGGELLVAVSTVGIAALAVFSYRLTEDKDPGLTTEIALLATMLLGALSVREPALAAAVSVVVAVLLAERSQLHRFVQDVLTEQELQDALLFAGATLVVLPLMPDHPVGPFAVLNPRTLWKLVVMVMSISAAGYIAHRALGPRLGIPLAGLASGFVSSAATIGSMGSRAAEEKELLRPAVAGAVLSTVSTIVQMAAVLFVTDRATLREMRLALLLSGIAAIIYGVMFAVRAAAKDPKPSQQTGRAFSLTTAVVFAATVSGILLASAAVNQWLGSRGLSVAAGLAGFADTHAAAISVASLSAVGRINPSDSVLPILAGLTTNTVTKIVIAVTTGGRRFALQVTPGLLFVILAAWAGFIWQTW